MRQQTCDGSSMVKRVRARVVLAALAAIVATSAPPAHAAGLFEEAGTPATVGDSELRARNVRVAVEAIRDAPTLTLDLFAGLQLEARRTGGESRSLASFDWLGVIDARERSSVAIVVDGDVVAANIRFDGRLFQVRATLGDHGIHRIAEVGPDAFADEGPDEVTPSPERMVEPPLSLDDGSRIDVLMVYTAAAAAASANIQTELQLAITETNQSYINSGVNQRVSLVHSEQVSYTESGDMSTDLDRISNGSDGFMDGVHALRDAYCADMVALIIETGGGCGIAYKMNTVSTSFASNAFSVTKRSCATGNYSFGHELGHNMGCNHDRYVSSGDQPFAYAYGYVNVPGQWRTIMAYNNECSDQGSSCSRLQYWSNPDVMYMGNPMGVAEGSSTAADNRKTLNNTALTVSQFRDSAQCTPGTAANLVLTKTLTSAATANTGSTVTFGIAVKNQGTGSLASGSLGDTIPSCFASIGLAGSPCPTGPGVPSVVCSGAGCAAATCTISNGGLGFVLSNYTLTATDGSPGGSDEITVTVSLVAGSPPGMCTNVAGTTDPTDGVITDNASVTILGTANLTLSETLVSPGLVAPGGTASFEVDLANTGTGALVSASPLGDTLSSCFLPIGVAGQACPSGPGAPSVRCTGGGCGVCTVSNGGYGFIYNGIALTPTDGAPGGGDEIKISVDVIASSTLGSCQNLAAIVDPVDGLIGAAATVEIRRPWAMELYWGNSVSGANAVWHMTDVYPFVTSSYYLPWVNDVAWHGSAVGDLSSADSTREILWRHQGTGDNVAWHLQGMTLLTTSVLSRIQDPQVVIGGAIDMSYDGNQDILWRNRGTGDNAVWLMNGTTVLSSAWLSALSDPAWHLVGGADFDGDGGNDLIWWHATTGDVAVWYMTGTSFRGGALLGQVADLDWQLVAVVDADDDGDGDLIWRNVPGGVNAVWTLEGSTLVRSTLLPGTTADWYLIGAR